MGPAHGLGKTKPISAGRAHGAGTGRACPRARLSPPEGLSPLRRQGRGMPVVLMGGTPMLRIAPNRPKLGRTGVSGGRTVGDLLCETNPIPARTSGGAKALRERSYGEWRLRWAPEKQSQFRVPQGSPSRGKRHGIGMMVASGGDRGYDPSWMARQPMTCQPQF
jgi:hypothetical protein